MLRIKKIYPIELVTFYYAVLTALYMLVLPGMVGDKLLPLLSARLIMLAVLFILRWLDTEQSAPITSIRQILPLAFILYWYPETYY
ncbi:MAG: hypothetical protein LBF69_02265, partial [Prevotellaceae bacterium]|nr:hypothetical protein [Prevotellaceae bacterium]